MDQTAFTIKDIADELESVEECLGFGDQLNTEEFHARARRGIRRARLMVEALAKQANGGSPELVPEAEAATPSTLIKLYPIIAPNPNAFPS